MTTAVQHRRGTTAEHAAFTGLEGEVTIDTTKDTAVIHDGTLAGGYPLAKENLANVTTSGLSSIDGASTASDDKFFIFDQSATSLKTITRAELNNAIEQDALANVAITGGTINGTAIGGTTPAAGAFTTLSASGAATLSGLTASTALALDGSKNIVSVTNTGTGSNVLATSPTLVTPALGTPSALVGTNITGTATSFNINGTVGATTPASGAFTTLSASGAVTLSGGTANGVAYLNGSKVVTSGSALTFDGSILGVSKSDTTNPSLFTVSNTSTTGSFAAAQMALKSYNGSSVVEGLVLSSISNSWSYGNTLANSAQVYTGLSNGLALVAESASGPIRFLLGSTASEQMRLTSTGLGIGTSSPAAKLHIKGSSNPAIYWENSSFGSATNAAFMGSAGQLVFGRAGVADWMTLDNSGNLGLGVTPSAWQVNNRALQLLEGYASISSNNSQGCCDVAFNCFNAGSAATSGWKYTNSGSAVSLFQQQAGAFKFLTAASGTAGNAITFTQAMTLDASGNLLVGTTTANTYSGYATFQLGQSTSGSIINFQGGATSTSSAAHIRLDCSGTTVSALTIETRNQAGTASTPIVFKIKETEAARIDSSGNLLVGTTTVGYGLFSGPKFTISAASDGICVGGLAQNNSAYTTQANNDTGNRYALYIANGSSNPVGNIAFTSTLTSYNTTSDYRLKNTIAPMTGALAKVSLLKPCTYKWNSNGSESEGFIAHELAEVVPHAVTGEKDAVDANGKIKPQSIDTSFLVATLTAAIQEQQAIIESLKARLDAANL